MPKYYYYIIFYQCVINLYENVSVSSATKPTWDNTTKDDIIINWLLSDIQQSTEAEIPNYDGSQNNLNNFNTGSTGELLKTTYPYVNDKPNNIPNINNLIKFHKCFDNATNGILYFFLGKQVLLEIMDLDNATIAHNLATPFIDGGIIYGNSRYKSLRHRSNGTHIDENGHLISYDLERKPPRDITESLTRIWLLWHNRIASKIKNIRKNSTSEDIFNEARKWTIAVQQNVYLYEWLTFWINMDVGKYNTYNSLETPQIPDYFNGVIYGLKNANLNQLMPKNLSMDNLGELIQTILSIRKTDNFALLKEFNSSLYSNEALHTLITGITEAGESICGNKQFLRSHIQKQFQRIRDGDRFWFEDKNNKIFSGSEIEKIRAVTFTDVYLTVKNYISNNNFSHADVQHFQPEETVKVINKLYLLAAVATVFIITNCIVLVIPMIIWKYRRNKKVRDIITNKFEYISEGDPTLEDSQNQSFSAREYRGNNQEPRNILVILNSGERKIILKSYSGDIIRTIDCDLNSKLHIQIYIICNKPNLVIKFPHSYDVILMFDSDLLRRSFLNAIEDFQSNNKYIEKELIKGLTWTAAEHIIVSKQHLQNGLEMFFRVAIAQTFKINHSRDEMIYVGADLANKVMNMKLTKYEFADALSIHLNNHFLRKIFELVDRDKVGLVSFREFVDLIIMFAEGNEEKKAKLLFDMYDIDGTGSLPNDEFLHMLSSFLKNTMKPKQKSIGGIINNVMQSVQTDEITFENFKKLIKDYMKYLTYAKLGHKIEKRFDEPHLLYTKRTLEAMNEGGMQDNIEEIQMQKENGHTRPNGFTLFENMLPYASLVFWVIFLTLVVLFIFIINFKIFDFNNNSEKSVISAICVGSAECLLFIYSVLLITMCSNVWSTLDDIGSRKYFPSNLLPILNRYFFIFSIFFTVMHVTTAFVMLFTEKGIATYVTLRNNLILYEPQYNWHLVFDLTIITGILLIVLVYSTYIHIDFKNIRMKFTQLKFYRTPHYMRKYLIVTLIIILFHGSQRKLQNPQYFNYMSLSLVLYFIDVLIRLNRKIIEVPIFKVEIHPSDVVCIIMRRPVDYIHTVGQTIRICIPLLDRTIYQEFWLSSAPCEPDLRVYIPAVDAWSREVFNFFDGTEKRTKIAPIRVRLEGPLGNGIKYWERYEVAVFIGDAIGVSQFASVLKEISNYMKIKADICCKKVYFIWVSDTHKQLEWLVDLIYETENNDPRGFFCCHIFVTEHYKNFDLRTILSFIFEKYYRRIYGKSLFMNLRALTYYNRPRFPEILKNINSFHPNSKLFGVFTSGSINFVNSIGKACTEVNGRKNKKFQYHPNVV
ncbi:dual oxidase 2-like isoform X1 [Rhynchophorus ferrugineus]|uniref:dual oxidase 2-like isoform X1 n=1 Tax=Rhynchophorus ferrugineus TaxID=354439 RepID=UPI003FCC5102